MRKLVGHTGRGVGEIAMFALMFVPITSPTHGFINWLGGVRTISDGRILYLYGETKRWDMVMQDLQISFGKNGDLKGRGEE